MADPFTAEIRMFPYSFAPKGWASCDGQVMPASQNTALFSLLGATYGGNGTTNFCLPDLRGRAPLQSGQGPGLRHRELGEAGGSETVTLTEAQMPAHNHRMYGSIEEGTQGTLGAGVTLAGSVGGTLYSPASGSMSTLGAGTLAAAGGGQPHNNMQPYLTTRFCIALAGAFPPRP